MKGVDQPPIQVLMNVDGLDVSMELGTGAAVSIMSEKQCNQLWPGRSLGATTIRLETYSKQPLAVLGSLDVQVVHEQQKVTLPLIIVEGNGPALFGRN